MKSQYQFQFGILEIEYENNILKQLKCVPSKEYVIDKNNQTTKFSDLVFQQVNEYLEGKRQSFDIPYELNGTEFQVKVWQALLKIPYGETRSYKEVAQMIGNPKASRAIGNANNQNPLLLIIPCHRVIGSNGNLVGYAGGLEMKRYLLELEGDL